MLLPSGPRWLEGSLANRRVFHSSWWENVGRGRLRLRSRFGNVFCRFCHRLCLCFSVSRCKTVPPSSLLSTRVSGQTETEETEETVSHRVTEKRRHASSRFELGSGARHAERQRNGLITRQPATFGPEA